MYILLSGGPPFGGKTDEEILQKVIEGKYSFKGFIKKYNRQHMEQHFIGRKRFDN